MYMMYMMFTYRCSTLYNISTVVIPCSYSKKLSCFFILAKNLLIGKTLLVHIILTYHT